MKLFLMGTTNNLFPKLQRIKKYKLQGMKYTKNIKYKINYNEYSLFVLSNMFRSDWDFLKIIIIPIVALMIR